MIQRRFVLSDAGNKSPSKQYLHCLCRNNFFFPRFCRHHLDFLTKTVLKQTHLRGCVTRILFLATKFLLQVVFLFLLVLVVFPFVVLLDESESFLKQLASSMIPSEAYKKLLREDIAWIEWQTLFHPDSHRSSSLLLLPLILLLAVKRNDSPPASTQTVYKRLPSRNGLFLDLHNQKQEKGKQSILY